MFWTSYCYSFLFSIEWRSRRGLEHIMVEEQDNLSRSNKKVKRGSDGPEHGRNQDKGEIGDWDERRKYSFRDSVIGVHGQARMGEGCGKEDEEASDDDAMDDEDDSPWFLVGMTKREKKEARKPWKFSVIIKLVRRKTIYINRKKHWISILASYQRAAANTGSRLQILENLVEKNLKAKVRDTAPKV